MGNTGEPIKNRENLGEFDLEALNLIGDASKLGRQINSVLSNDARDKGNHDLANERANDSNSANHKAEIVQEEMNRRTRG
jgi:hypothetical protein